MISVINQYYSQQDPKVTARNIQSQDSASNAMIFSSALSKAYTPDKTYLSQLQMKFGSKVSIQEVDKNKSGIDAIGNRTFGTGNITIASNIAKKMEVDPEVRRYYEQKIQAHFDTNGEANAFMAMRGMRITSRGVVIHPNGEVTYYCSGDYTPEEKARLERAMKEEDEAKAKKLLKEKIRLERAMKEEDEAKVKKCLDEKIRLEALAVKNA